MKRIGMSLPHAAINIFFAIEMDVDNGLSTILTRITPSANMVKKTTRKIKCNRMATALQPTWKEAAWNIFIPCKLKIQLHLNF